MFALVLGGVRSGKSAFAETLAARLSGGQPLLYLATLRPVDDESRARIARHRARRPPIWKTLEVADAPITLFDAIASPSEPVLLDGVDLWLSSLLEDHDDDALAAYGARLAGLLAARRAPTVAVSLEAGLGLVPQAELARRFVDRLGELNAALARRADLVVFVAAGLPLVLKGQPKGELP